MPLTAKGKKIRTAMRKRYGAKKGDEVFYASENAGTITGVAKKKPTRKKATRRRSSSKRGRGK